MIRRHPPVVSLPIRITAGIIGVFLVTLAILAPRIQPGGAAPGLVIGFVGLLLLVPALKASALKSTAAPGAIAGKYRMARKLQWTCLVGGFVGLFISSRRAGAGALSNLWVVVLFMVLWLAGFGFAGVASYYLEQAKQLADGSDDDPA